MIVEFLLFLATILICLYIWQNNNNNYWKRHNVKFVKPLPFIGNMKDMFMVKKSIGGQLWSLYNTAGFEKEPVVGMYALQKPALLVRDVALIKRVLIKDFGQFSNRSLTADPHYDSIGSKNLFFIKNPEWRDLRVKLTPVFTSGKVKKMYPLMLEVCNDLENSLAGVSNNGVIDIKNLSSRYTIDVIGTIAFGLRANCLKNPESDFYKKTIAVFENSFKRAFDFFVISLIPSLATLLHVKLFSKTTTKLLRSTMKHVIEERERSGDERNDLIDILIALKKDALANPEKKNPAKDFDFLVAQASLFQTAGYETSASTMTFTLYELAKQPELQDRLRAEIADALVEGEGTISYEKIQEMTYLSQVVDETLRKYPILPFLDRTCTPEKGNAGYPLKPYYNDFDIPAGMTVYISAIGVQRDEKHWPNPEKYDPERFSAENRKNINWDAYMPFGIGPHACIGQRIGLLQSKLGIVHVLKNARVIECAETPKEINFAPQAVTLIHTGSINLKVEHI